MKKTYLGDSVYARFYGYTLILTTENGLPGDPSNVNILEQNVIEGLLSYIEYEFQLK